MKQGPSFLCEILFKLIDLDASPRPLVDIITEIIIAEQWCITSVDAREKAERWERQTLTRIQQELNIYQEVGRPPRLTFNSSSQYMIQGACFIEPRDSLELQERKKRRLRFTDYYLALNDLTPRQFELLCGKLIKLIGVNDPIVTRSSSDEGIDFYGRLRLDSIFFPQDLSPTIQKQLTIWLVGQAKHYRIVQSGTSEIRDLFGSIALGRAGAFGSVNSPLHDLEIRVGDPVFALLVTTSTLSSNAWRLLMRSGVIGMDGEMLAAFLADREGGISTSDFNKNDFVTWIET